MQNIYITLPFQSSYLISTDCVTLVEKINLFYGPYVHTKKGLADFHIVILKHESNYIFKSDWGEYQTDCPLIFLDRHRFDNTLYDGKIFAMHGAAVEWAGECYLLLSKTGGGKTTLTTYLSNYNFGYLTDDCILLDRDKFDVHPCAMPVHLRRGGVDILKKHGVFLDNIKFLTDSPWFERYVYDPPLRIEKPIPLRRIFFIERTTNKNELIELSSLHRAKKLLEAPIIPYEMNSEYLKFISKLVTHDCKVIRYSDMNFVKECIINCK